MKSHISAILTTADWRVDILDNPLTPTVVAHVLNTTAQTADEIKNANLREVPELAAALQAAPELERQRAFAHFIHHTETFACAVEHDFDISYPNYDFIAEQGTFRAQQKYPLAVQLHSYRIGQRVCWETLCQSLIIDSGPMPESAWRLMIALSVFTFEYVNHISTVLASAYYKESSRLEQSASSVRSEFIDRLMRKPDDPTLARTAARFDFDADSNYLVVVARASESHGNSSDEISEVQSCLDKVFEPLCEHRLTDLWRGDAICILSADKNSDRDFELTLNSEVREKIAEMGCRIGISTSQKGLNTISDSYEDAITALEQSSTEQPVVRFNAISVFDHLVTNAKNSAYRLKPPWVDALVAEDRRAGGVLLQTLNTYVNCRMSAKKAAELLKIHTNTVYQRINKIEELCQLTEVGSPKLIDILVVANLHLHNGHSRHNGK